MNERRTGRVIGVSARRRFLKAASAFVLLAASGLAVPRFSRAGEPRRATPGRDIARLFRLPRKARVLGERYLALHPEAADRDLLLGRLGWPDAPISGAALRRRFVSLRERDFAQNRIVAIDGWVLARAEADLCALLSLG